MVYLKKTGLIAASVILLTTSSVQAATLNGGQIQSVLNLLQSFNVDQSMRAAVARSLLGTTTSSAVSSVLPANPQSCVDLTNNLVLGSTDAAKSGDVSKLQNYLISNQYISGPATGYYDVRTRQAAGNMQIKLGIVSSTADPSYGYVGPRTRIALACGSVTPTSPLPTSASGQPPPSPTTSSTSPPPPSCADITHTMRVGSTDQIVGGDVTHLQTYLIANGYLRITSTTGYYGVMTRSAVGALQIALKVVASASTPGYGNVGPRTLPTIMCDGTNPSGTTATLTANGATEITVNAGEPITYAWNSEGGVSAKGSFTTDSPACSVGSGPIEWDLANTLSGSQLVYPGDCSAGHTYTFTYTVTDVSGGIATAKVTVHVNPSGTTATLTANGATEITVNAGEPITYAWNSINGVNAKGSFTIDSPACGSGTGPNAWDLPNTLSGSATINPALCGSGHTYTFRYTVTDAKGGTASASVIVHQTFALSAGPCAKTPGWACATYPGKSEMPLFSGTIKPANSSYPIDSAYMGSFKINGAWHDLAYVYGSITSYTIYPAGDTDGGGLFVVDLTTNKEIAFTWSPGGYFNSFHTYFSYITDSSGNKYPFIAPGDHYLKSDNEVASERYAVWDYMCIFNVTAINAPVSGCATGFAKYSTTFTTADGQTAAQASGFRHSGGWQEDVDGDGWTDINLPFLQYILTISGHTGKQLGLAHFDVASQTEPLSPPYFHSGRFYGGLRTFTDPQTGAHDVLFSDGMSVGNTDWESYCNVSSYMAVGQWNGTALNLKWSNYLSFAKTIFNAPYDSINNYSRLGNDINNCANWIGNDIAQVNNHPYIVYDRFVRTTSAPMCQQETLNEQKANFTSKTANATTQCFNDKVLPLTGNWSARVLDAGTGKEVSSLPNSYVWGSAPNVVPGKSPTYLVQEFTSSGGVVAYKDTATAAGSSLSIAVLGSNAALSIVARGVMGTPTFLGKYGQAYGAFAPGTGSDFGGIPELVLKDVDGDGLNDIQLSNGKWLGYSATSGSLVQK